ncbi:MAG: helix-turn-helix transcriptional regulator [Coriobacteriales bacterium]|jgi:DNA-binding CsgD family transcriptional regulator|nr:helix-turn-helix transcriptional regulator [Coriobacteriales bacterium]
MTERRNNLSKTQASNNSRSSTVASNNDQPLMTKNNLPNKISNNSLLSFVLCLISMLLLFFTNWSINSMVFPLYDKYFFNMREVCTAASGVVLILIALLSIRRARQLHGIWLVAGLLFGTIIGVMLVFIGDFIGNVIVLGIGACLLTSGMGISMVVTGLGLISQSPKRTLICIVAAELVIFQMRYLAPAGYSVIRLFIFTSALIIGALIVYPLAKASLIESEGGVSPIEASIVEPASYLPFGHQLFICLFLFRIVYGFILTFGAIDGIPTESVWGLVAVGILFIVVMINSSMLSMNRLFNIAFLFALAGFLLVPAHEVIKLSVTHGLLSCSIGVFEIFNYYVLISLARRNRRNAISTFSWGTAILVVGVISGANLGRFTNHYWASNDQVVILIVAGLTLTLVAYTIIFLRDFSFDKTIAEVIEHHQPVVRHRLESPVEIDSFDRKCDTIALQHNLTKRQTEIFKLLAKGRSGVFIQNELMVSYNTIKAHVKHIYLKLDVHTQQELIDLVEF